MWKQKMPQCIHWGGTAYGRNSENRLKTARNYGKIAMENKNATARREVGVPTCLRRCNTTYTTA